VITPKVVGDRLGLSPVVILLSLLLWGTIWGIPGALLSVPIASIIRIVCENVSSLRAIAVMMGSGGEFQLDQLGQLDPITQLAEEPLEEK
jgi:predicted PurR-regulated permease PerM